MIGARRCSKAIGCRRPCHEAPRLRSDERVRSPGRNVHPTHQSEADRGQDPARRPQRGQDDDVGPHRQRPGQQRGDDDRNESCASQSRQRPNRRCDDRHSLTEAQGVEAQDPAGAEDHFLATRACTTRRSYTVSCDCSTGRTSTGAQRQRRPSSLGPSRSATTTTGPRSALRRPPRRCRRGAPDQCARLAEDRRTARPEGGVEGLALEGQFVQAVRAVLRGVVVGHQ